MWRFITENRRWLATGLLLAFGSCLGQTWFISLFAGEIRAEYGLSDGQWGLLYTAATLASAALLFGRGSLADTMPLSRLAPMVAVLFAGAAALMALGWAVWTLGIAVFLLRFCGQGMFSHIQMTAMARWFVATRGRAIAIANLGYTAGQVLLPLPAVLLLGWIGWQASWGVVAGVILFIILPLLLWLLAQDRAPKGSPGAAAGAPGLGGRHWRRPEAMRHWLFWALVPLMLTPGYIGTVVFFHQVHISEIKGWTLAAMAPAYAAWALSEVAASFAAGWLCDRIGPTRLLPFVVVPLALGIFLIGVAETPLVWIVAIGMVGLTQDMSNTVWGTLLPAVYGTDHIGSVRAVASAVIVVSTALGPGVAGVIIDAGVPVPAQAAVMAAWCALLSLAMVPVMRGVLRAQ
ncbi:MFS transporter [Roseicyclus mahoneyensis]|uniref:MFS transporter n=1 Tax=Roseicyclus mahoneyensis TaxID=164332 RepID=A0A316GJR6_9RHOB|nr:MFS transporter [Roseicyclus mahoneyensis]PWK60234.1 MFS transporter [Roseicyclus mahoneyensis]